LFPELCESLCTGHAGISRFHFLGICSEAGSSANFDHGCLFQLDFCEAFADLLPTVEVHILVESLKHWCTPLLPSPTSTAKRNRNKSITPQTSVGHGMPCQTSAGPPPLHCPHPKEEPQHRDSGVAQGLWRKPCKVALRALGYSKVPMHEILAHIFASEWVECGRNIYG
jgi:hypothetical protein